MNTRIIAAAEAVMVAAVMLAAGCGSAAASTPTPTPSPTHSVMSLAASSTSPSPSHSAPPTTPPTLPATTFPVAALLAACYPTTSNGDCYLPGEYCPESAHGMTGVAADGTQIICQDNNGWRWEPVSGTAPATGGGGTAGFQDALLLGLGVAALLAGAGNLAYRRRLTRKR